jgi:hypothetical protein
MQIVRPCLGGAGALMPASAAQIPFGRSLLGTQVRCCLEMRRLIDRFQ